MSQSASSISLISPSDDGEYLASNELTPRELPKRTKTNRRRNKRRKGKERNSKKWLTISNQDLFGSSPSNSTSDDISTMTHKEGNNQFKNGNIRNYNNNKNVNYYNYQHQSSEEIRIRDKKQVYVLGLSSDQCNPHLLKSKIYFGRYGDIEMMFFPNIQQKSHYYYINDINAVKIQYFDEESAEKAINFANNFVKDDRIWKASYGWKYFCHFGEDCRIPNCHYVHSMPPKDEIVSHQEIINFKAQFCGPDPPFSDNPTLTEEDQENDNDDNDKVNQQNDDQNIKNNAIIQQQQTMIIQQRQEINHLNERILGLSNHINLQHFIARVNTADAETRQNFIGDLYNALDAKYNKLKQENKELIEKNERLNKENKRLGEENKMYHSLKGLEYLQWDHSKVYEWIISLDNGYFKKFDPELCQQLKCEDIDGSCLKNLKSWDLERIGVNGFRDQMTLSAAIQKLIKVPTDKETETEKQ